jgi:hypothetical protein
MIQQMATAAAMFGPSLNTSSVKKKRRGQK